MTCAQCGADLKPVFDLHPLRRRDDWTVQYDDSLPMTFHTGYGMFADTLDDVVGNPDRDHTAILCKSCADAFVEANPWSKRFIDTRLDSATDPYGRYRT